MPTVLHRLAHWADSTPSAPAQGYKEGGVWKDFTAREYCDRVYYLALFLEARGVLASESGGIFAPNCFHWVHLHLALQLRGAQTAGIYPNSTSKDVHYILNHTDAVVLGVKDREFYTKITEHGPLSDKVRLIIVFNGDTSIHPKAVAYETAIAEGKKLASSGGRSLAEYLGKVDPKGPAFLIYTSGTTGSPKGALLSQENLAFTSDRVAEYWKLPFENGSLFSFLPLCHIAEQLQSIGVGITQRYQVFFCTKFDNVSKELVEVQPTLLLSVPRLWEKMMEGVQSKIGKATGAQKVLLPWALGVGERVAAAKYSGRMPSPLDLAQHMVARVLIQKIRHAMGLARAQMLASGAAALPAHVSKWFRCLGLEILEDYGQTESTGVILMTVPDVECAGTVGKPLPGMDFKLAEDGEILTKGKHVFIGYYKDDAATASTVVDGWLHTGDLGEITPQGMVRIRGRKKEIMKTSGGKMIAPLPIEEQVKVSPLISQACMVGDGRKFASMLITLSEGRLAELKNKVGAFDGVLVKDAETLAEVRAQIDAVNGKLAGYEQIKRFTVLSREFSIEDGEMTPTLKMKRNVIETRFKDLIEKMYG